MESLSTLTSAVKLAIDDESFTDDDIRSFLNRGLLEIAGGGTRDFDVPTLNPLPNLRKEFEIQTVVGERSVAMPADYQRGGLQGFGSNGSELTRYDSLLKFNRAYRGEQGSNVEAYCIVGNSIYYHGSPSTIKSFYVDGFAYPTVMENADDIPVALPAHLQNRLLVNYACMEFYGLIEQDIRKRGQNVVNYTNAYATALTDLYSAVEGDEEASYVVQER